jgi:hypothetical protein
MTMRRRLVVILLCCLAVVPLWGPASAQSVIEKLVSPGPLSNPHARFESNCASCHVSFDKTAQPAKCQECHRDVGADIRNKTGFHGRSPEVANAPCKTCHTDHKGRGAQIVQLDPGRFNHALTDFALVGKHAAVGCTQCHAAGGKYAKTPSDCASCHGKTDPHKGSLGQACASCHTAADWKATTFDHQKSSFPLTGAHTRAKCADCHAGQVWKGLPSTCSSCHAKEDPHRGRLGQECQSCHVTQAWKVSGFDHSRTRFKLVGAHASTGCASCHKDGMSVRLQTTCISCHAADDKHKGANGPECATCHWSANWTNIRFDHDATRFPLKGKHASAKCETCHVRPIAAWKPPTGCNGCHLSDDKHKGVFGPDCQTCHVETAWARVRFDHAKDARFALNGRHAAADCAACHLQQVKLKPTPITCIGCHRKDDPHKGQLGDGCGTCHGEAKWTTAVRFDHGLSDFPLLGKHAQVACKDCHATPAFLDAKTDCFSCHQKKDVHQGRYGRDCAQCHNPADWKRWRFDHAKQANYPLTGRHQSVACASCHAKRLDVSTRCVSCHAADDKHRGSFGASCERCHTTEAFWAVDLKR